MITNIDYIAEARKLLHFSAYLDSQILYEVQLVRSFNQAEFNQTWETA